MLKKIILSLFILLVISSCKLPLSAKHEGRAIWMSRFEYPVKNDAEKSKAYIKDFFEKARKAKFNMIVFQVRGNGDAFYKSSFEPWGSQLTGELGKDPGWDPLAYAVETAHELGLELHAWINVFPAWRDKNNPPDSTEILHPMLAHPEWIVCDSTGRPMNPDEGYITFSPGIPAVHEHIQKVVSEIVSNYDIDGLHFDYIRYPEWSNRNNYSQDKISLERFGSKDGNPNNLNWEAWQREQVHIFVRNTYNLITDLKSWVKVSAAVIGSHQQASWNGYFAVYQDARTWLAEGKMDMIFPMTYTATDHPTVPYAQSLAEWANMKYLGRHIMPGIPIYKLGRSVTLKMIWEQIAMVRQSKFSGMVFFSGRAMKNAFEHLGEVEYHNWADVPTQPWKNSTAPDPVVNFQAKWENNKIILNWQHGENTNSDQVYHIIYKSVEKIADITLADNILYITPRGKQTLEDENTEDDHYYYAVTIVDRFGNESRPVQINVTREDAKIIAGIK